MKKNLHTNRLAHRYLSDFVCTLQGLGVHDRNLCNISERNICVHYRKCMSDLHCRKCTSDIAGSIKMTYIAGSVQVTLQEV